MKNYLLSLCLVTGLVIAACVIPQNAAGNEILIGAPWDLSGYSKDTVAKNRISAQMAIDEINAAGGINGMPLRLIIYDTGQQHEKTEDVVRRLITEDKVLAMIGPYSSDECSRAFPIANELGVAMISQASSKPGLARKFRPFAFRNTIDEVRMARVAGKAFVRRHNIKKVAVIHDTETLVGLSLGAKILPTVLKNLGVRIVNEGNYITFASGTDNFEPQMARLKQLDFDGIAFGGVYSDGTPFTRALREHGFQQPILGGSPILGGDFAHLGQKADGLMAPCTFHSSIAPRTFTDEFARRAEAAGIEATPLQFDANVYDALRLLSYVIEKTGVRNRQETLAQDRQRIMKGLRAFALDKGLVGPVRFNADGDADKPVFVAEMKNGTWTIQK